MTIKPSRRRPVLLGLALAAFACAGLGCGNERQSEEVAVLETSYGRIVIEFLPNRAPRHVAHFKQLFSEDFYSGTRFHRIVAKSGKPVAIQGGDPNTRSGATHTWGLGQPDQKTVAAEFSAELKHERAAVSAARRADDVNSATSQFFICVTAEPQWDGQYSIFGRVVEGINVVDSISRAPVWPNSDRPLDPVVVNRSYLASRGDLK